MAVKEKIEILVKPDGDVMVHVHGITMDEFINLTKFLEESLGEVKTRKFNREAYEKEVRISGKKLQKEKGYQQIKRK